ncbi:hypothetical protein WAI453_004769 [Rhynchosporium graminicola]|uniref:Thioredoxin domain-containing protein n=1 Tax=Rhynchosporium graminicola TaxID=2792576 RepID=A0A1E1LGA8_9HELO|nr:uncharacterized protein RCO7_03669 [Rhynchosporium commune]
MPLLGRIIAPATVRELNVSGPGRPLFVTFISSNHPETGKSWCPDVRTALPILNAAFASREAPEMVYIEVGQRPEWKAQNAFRTDWNLHNVPTLVKFERVDGEVKETARLEEEGIKDKQSLDHFVKS